MAVQSTRVGGVWGEENRAASFVHSLDTNLAAFWKAGTGGTVGALVAASNIVFGSSSVEIT